MTSLAKILALVLVLSILTTAQTVIPPKPTDTEEQLRKDAIAFLRETLVDVNGMRSLENRISFNAELAGLMWFHDEREARSMYVAAIAEFKDLLARYETRMNEFGAPTEDDEPYSPNPFSFDPSDRNRLMRKFQMAIAVRQQMAMSIAEHDPDLAFGFVQDTLSMVANPGLRKEVDNSQAIMESALISQIAERHPDKAVKFGRKAIEKGIEYQHIELLKKLYAKDPEKGAEFGLAILNTAKNGKAIPHFILDGLITFGGESLEASRKPDGKRPVFREPELRELTEVLALALLEMDDASIYLGEGYIATVQKYLPGRAAQIKTKFKLSQMKARANTNSKAAPGDFEVNEDEFAEAMAAANANSSSADQRRAEREKAEKKLLEDVGALAGKQLPKEERNRVISESRKIIATTPGRDKKVAALSLLAAQVAKLGDKELAAEIMRDAAGFVNPAPKNMQDFLLSWMLASGYAAADPDKAFPLLEETIGRANDTLAAFVKVGEFIDVNEDFIVDGEVQVGAFGGQMVRGLAKEVGMADATIEVLAKVDFNKTKNLASRFDRLEIRVLAKMMVLRAVLDPKAKPDSAPDKVELSAIK